MIELNLQFFGGRGSSSSGGATGGVGAGTVVSTESLLSASGKRKEIAQTMQAVKNVADRYGVDLSDIQLATMKGSPAMAYYDSRGNLAVNKSYFDSKK